MEQIERTAFFSRTNVLLPDYMDPFLYDEKTDRKKLSFVYLNVERNFVH